MFWRVAVTICYLKTEERSKKYTKIARRISQEVGREKKTNNNNKKKQFLALKKLIKRFLGLLLLFYLFLNFFLLCASHSLSQQAILGRMVGTKRQQKITFFGLFLCFRKTSFLFFCLFLFLLRCTLCCFFYGPLILLQHTLAQGIRIRFPYRHNNNNFRASLRTKENPTFVINQRILTQKTWKKHETWCVTQNYRSGAPETL